LELWVHLGSTLCKLFALSLTAYIFHVNLFLSLIVL
jgi:hypothetical protein